MKEKQIDKLLELLEDLVKTQIAHNNILLTSSDYKNCTTVMEPHVQKFIVDLEIKYNLKYKS